MADAKKRSSRLGRGLSTLMSTEVPVDTEPTVPAATPEEAPPPPPETGQESIQSIPVDSVDPNPQQPRQAFDETGIESLAASIRSAGVMQPIVVRPKEDGWELVAGERRWRAARQAGLEHIPAIVRKLDERESAEWALIENLQREDLNPMERAEAFRRLSERFELDHAAIAERVGVGRVTVTNTLRLLSLHPEVQEMVRDGQLSQGQAKVLAGIEAQDAQRELARRAVSEGMTVRALEAAGREGHQATPHKSAMPSSKTPRSPQLVALEQQITDQLQTKVSIRAGRKKGAGTITIHFYSLDEFDGLLERLGVETN